MKTWLLPVAVAAMTLAGGAAMAQPYGYYGDGYYSRPAYNYGYAYGRGYDGYYRHGAPDRAGWNRDRDHDGRPDWRDRWDHYRRDWRDGYHRRYEPAPYYGYGYRY